MIYASEFSDRLFFFFFKEKIYILSSFDSIEWEYERVLTFVDDFEFKKVEIRIPQKR